MSLYLIRMADIGEEEEEVTFEPLTTPAEEPVKTPAEVPVAA